MEEAEFEESEPFLQHQEEVVPESPSLQQQEQDDDDFASNAQQVDESVQGEGGGHWFEIVKHDAREIYQVVKALAFREYCTLVVSNEGIRIVVDDQHNQQGNAYFKYEQFSDYNLHVMVCNLRIPINVLMETFNMFTGNNTVLRMWYNGDGCPLMVCIEDEGIVVQVAIRTMNLQSMLDFEFTNAFVQCKAIMNPGPMREILRDLDQTAESVVITFTANYISFYTVGSIGKIKVEIPSTSDQLEHLSCVQERVSFQYRTTFIKRMTDCIRLCNKISIRIDQRGVLSAQLIIPQTEQVVFAEFYCVADEDSYHPSTI